MLEGKTQVEVSLRGEQHYGVRSIFNGMPFARFGVVLLVDEGKRDGVPCLLQKVMTAAVHVVQGKSVSHCWICSCRIS